jgi:hypothetical protein
MKHSPLLYSSTLIASLTLLNIGSAWSAPELQVKPKATTAEKAKTSKAKAGKKHVVSKAAPFKLASVDAPKSGPAVASIVTTNPYLASQPVAILPQAANPYLPSSAISAAVAATPAMAAVHITPAPGASAPAIALPVTQPVAAATPSVAPPVAIPAPVAVQMPAATPPVAPVASYQPWNAAPASPNPYLANQPAYTSTDLAKLFSQFGNGLKISLPSLPQPSNSAPAMANPTQTAFADATNSLGQIFTSLKMALPSFPQPVVTPTQTAIADTSNSFNQIVSGLKSVLPSLPSSDTTLLPVIKTVYPTGEKPLVVLNFKCPTEMLGVTPPPMKLLHELVNFGFDGLNKTNLLSFNLQQVCS